MEWYGIILLLPLFCLSISPVEGQRNLDCDRINCRQCRRPRVTQTCNDRCNSPECSAKIEQFNARKASVQARREAQRASNRGEEAISSSQNNIQNSATQNETPIQALRAQQRAAREERRNRLREITNNRGSADNGFNNPFNNLPQLPRRQQQQQPGNGGPNVSMTLSPFPMLPFSPDTIVVARASGSNNQITPAFWNGWSQEPVKNAAFKIDSAPRTQTLNQPIPRAQFPAQFGQQSFPAQFGQQKFPAQFGQQKFPAQFGQQKFPAQFGQQKFPAQFQQQQFQRISPPRGPIENSFNPATRPTSNQLRNIDSSESSCNKPGFQPCIGRGEANTRMIDCCRAKGLPEGCLSLCNYDSNRRQIQRAVLGQDCPLEHVGQVLKCGSGGQDVTECCQAKGVLNGNKQICSPFCNPKGGLPEPNARYLKCANQISTIANCFHAKQPKTKTNFAKTT